MTADTPAATVTVETERKFDASARLRSEALVQATGYASQGMEEQDLAAQYFDTGDLRLLRSGVTLRRRTGGHDAGWHLKMPGGVDSRTEIRLPLTEEHRPPQAFVDATQVYSLGAELVAVATLSTRRLRWPLLDLGGHEIAELVDDLVSAYPAGTIAAPRTWREIEVELRDGVGTSVLDVIETRLSSLGVRRSPAASKLARVLEGHVPVRARSKITRASSAGEVVVAYLRTQAEVLCHFDPLARAAASDAVHQMRVAARRMRGALQSFGDVLDHDRTADLVGELRWMAGELAPARDVEVMAARFAEVLDQLPAGLDADAVRVAIESALRVRADQAHDAVTAALSSSRYLQLHRGIAEVLEHPPLTRRARRRAGPVLAAGIRRGLVRLEKRMRTVERSAPGNARELALHDARKAAKRLRYASEVTTPALGKSVIRLQKRLRLVTVVLGDHQDAVVARAVLRELGTQADQVGGHGFTYGVMHGIETARAETSLRRLRKAWRRARSAAI